jgi:hypothetical protein
VETVYGAPGFDSPCAEEIAAVKLIRRIGAQKFPHSKILIHEGGQGFFPSWLLEFLRGENPAPEIALSGRNILSLNACVHNTEKILNSFDLCKNGAGKEIAVRVFPSAGLANIPAPEQYDCVFAFPEFIHQSMLPKGTNQIASFWESAARLIAGGGLFIAAFDPSTAERFDRAKPAGFSRIANIKRKGARALAYRLSPIGARPFEALGSLSDL